MAGDARRPGQGSPAPDPDRARTPRSEVPAAPLALYRRYRPGTFAEVKGQDHVTEPLRQALRSGRVHHAYLFSGPRGCGKTSSARILARSLNCELGPTSDPCGKCPSCVALAPAGPGSIDVIEIDAASHGGVDDARDLRERAFYAPVSGRFKIYIIDEAHMVTREGFNALLKLVEEPPPHLKFVFATTEPEKVIPTIRSRTHHYPFRLVPPAILREHLEQILASEAVPYEPAVLPVVIRAGAGSVRDALSVLDQLLAGSDESGLRYDRAIALLGYTDDRLLDEVIDAFAAEDGAAVFQAIDQVVEAGHDPRRFAADLLDRLRDLIVLSAVPDAAATGLIDAPPDRLEPLTKQAGAVGRAGLTRAAEMISAGLVEMRGATQPRLLLELMCAQVLLPAAGKDAAGLADRLDRLERRLSAAAPGQAETSVTAPVRRDPAPPRPDAARSQPDPAPRPAQPRQQGAAPPPAQLRQREQPRPDKTPEPTGAAVAQPARAPADTAALVARWPDVLEAVQGRKRVARMQLNDASVASFEDGLLTLAFAHAGTATGFLTGGYDRVLGEVFADMFGVAPRIATSVATGDTEPGTRSVEAGAPEDSDRRPGQPPGRDGAPGPDRGAGSVPGERATAREPRQAGTAAGATRQAASARRPARQAGGAPGDSATATADPAPAPDEPQPYDAPDPDVLTGSGLIERELGGQIIHELDEQ
jgi:DNA polymerase III subunit gamma/tau